MAEQTTPEISVETTPAVPPKVIAPKPQQALQQPVARTPETLHSGGTTPQRGRSPAGHETPGLEAPGADGGERTFGKDLWCNFEAVLSYCEADPPLLKDMRAYFKAIAESERSFSNELSKASTAFMKKLTSKHSGQNYVFCMLSGVSLFVQSSLREATIHGEYAGALETDVVANLDAAIAKSEAALKSLAADGRALLKEEKEQLASHARAREAFHKLAKEYELSDSSLDEMRRANKDLDKADKKQAKIRDSMEQAAGEYAHEVAATNALLTALIDTRMASVLEQLQAAHMEIRTGTKAVLLAANQHAADEFAALSEVRAQSTAFFNELNPAGEVQTYIASTLPPTTRPETLSFAEYEEQAETTRRRRLQKIATPRGVRLAFTPKQVFAIPLFRALERQVTSAPGLRVPALLLQIFQWIRSQDGAHARGLFRLQGNEAAVDTVANTLDLGLTAAPAGVANAVDLLKLWLELLCAPLVTEEAYDAVLAAAAVAGGAPVSQAEGASPGPPVPTAEAPAGEGSERQGSPRQPPPPPAAADPLDPLRAALASIPTVNRDVLLHLVAFLAEFTTPEVVAVTGMTLPNIAASFACFVLQSPSRDPVAHVANLEAEIQAVRIMIAQWAALDMEGAVASSEGWAGPATPAAQTPSGEVPMSPGGDAGAAGSKQRRPTMLG